MGDAAKQLDTSGLVVTLTQDQLRALVEDAVRAANANSVPEYLDPTQVGKWLGVDEKTVRGWIVNEGLTASKLGARLYRLKRADVIAWIEEKAHKPRAHTTKHVERLVRAKAGG